MQDEALSELTLEATKLLYRKRPGIYLKYDAWRPEWAGAQYRTLTGLQMTQLETYCAQNDIELVDADAVEV